MDKNTALFYNRFANQVFTRKTIDISGNFEGSVIVMGSEYESASTCGLQLRKRADRKETNIPAYYLGFQYKTVYISSKINPSGLVTDELILNYGSFSQSTILILAQSDTIFGLVISSSDLLSDEFRNNVYLPLMKNKTRIDSLYIVLDGVCDETRILCTDIENLTGRVIIYGTIDDYIKLDPKARYSARTVFTKTNPVRMDLLLARSVRADEVTAVVRMSDLDFISNGTVEGTKPVRGMFLPLDLYEAFCLEGNFMTYDVELVENGRLNFPTRYNRAVTFYTSMCDIIITNSDLNIELIFNINLINKYKLEYKKLIKDIGR